MSDASYDAIVVGGGHNGLIVACYLAMNGMKVGVFEEKWELGGGACSEEYTAPGFISDPCASSMRFPFQPPFKDLNLAEYGLRFIFPRNNGSIIFDNEDYIVSYPSYSVDAKTGDLTYIPGPMEKSYQQIAKYSERDAETALKLHERFDKYWKEKAKMSLLNPPPPPGEKDPLEELLEDPVNGIDPRHQLMSIAELAYDLFESSQMRVYFIRSTASATTNHPSSVIPLLCYVFSVSQLIGGSPAGVTVGGTHAITHALQKFLCSNGGKFWVLSPVDKVLIDNGTAKGIRLVDGTEIEAKKLVVSNLDVHQTIFRLIGEKYVNEEIRRKVKNLDSSGGCLWWGSFALHEAPKYKVEAIEPDALTLRSYLCPNDDHYQRYKYQAEIFSHSFPSKLYIHPYHHSSFDPSRAPAGKYEVAFEEYSCPASFFTLKEWLGLKKEFLEELLKQWQVYAPNMTWDNIIDIHINSPYEIQMRNSAMREGCVAHITWDAPQGGRNRPIPELSRYRTPIKNLYMASGSCHTYGTVTGDPGYNCYKMLVEDFGLEKVWEKAGRPY
jgi:phytoene dehydrogenase-like protein